MSEMVERMAKAAARRHYAKRFEAASDSHIVSINVENNWQIFVADIRSTIADMREPTEVMAEAIWAETGDPCWKENAVRAWQAGIDEALK